MVPFYILLGACVILRLIGFFGFHPLSSWRDSARIALSVMFIFTGITHFTGMKIDYAAMIPEPFPNSISVIYLSGILEIMGAFGIHIPRLRKAAGLCLIILLVAMLPANINAALNDVPFRGNPPTSLWLRIPVQIIFIAVAWWTSVKSSHITKQDKEISEG